MSAASPGSSPRGQEPFPAEPGPAEPREEVPGGAVDVHAHFVAPAVLQELRRNGQAYGVRVEEGERGPVLHFPRTASRPFFAAMSDLDRRLEEMDRQRVAFALLSTWVDIFGYDLDGEEAVRYCRLVNNALTEAVRSRPDRLAALATVPAAHPAAARELERAVLQLGMRGLFLGTNILGRNLDDPLLEPLWQAAEGLDVPVVLHPVNTPARERLASYYLGNLIGNPLETTVAAASLILGGVLDRHPGLRVVLLHGGGYFPWAVGRLDHGYRVRPETRARAARTPGEYVKRFHYDTVVYDRRILAALAGVVGWERILLGSDCPFDMQLPEPVRFVRESVQDPEDFERVCRTNAAAIFGLAGR